MDIVFNSDGYALKGVLTTADGLKPPVVIGSHGLFSSGNSPKQIALAHALNLMGISFFRFDHRGCGESEGNFKNVTSLENRRKDLLNSVFALKDNGVNTEVLGLFGSSFGGSVVLSAFKEIKAKAAVTVAAPVKSGPVKESLKRVRDSVVVGKGKEPFMPDETFIEKSLCFDLHGDFGNVSHLLVIHGEKDEIVPQAHAYDIFSNAREPKKILVFPNGDHRVANPVHQEEFIKSASIWFFNHLMIK